jgi:cytochrome bd-type quinol oxidase subunit 2
MTSAELVAVVLWVAAMLYAVFGGADFGAGVWDLLAGGARSGARPRALIDRALTPVWEANHVWLIFLLVIMWTAFPTAFAAITTTLFVPLTLAALGIVLRGSGFAFRKVVEGLGGRRAFGAIFASSSLITPFFLGAAVGAIVSGDVHVGGSVAGASTWLSLISVTIGVLFVATSSHVASVFLVAEARRSELSLAYLRIAVSPRDELALRRVLNYPTRGVGAQSIDKLVVAAHGSGATMWDALATTEVTGPARTGIEKFKTAVEVKVDTPPTF